MTSDPVADMEACEEELAGRHWSDRFGWEYDIEGPEYVYDERKAERYGIA